MSVQIFKVYRYQILPIDRYTPDMFNGLSIEELIKQKNDIFAQSVQFIKEYRHRNSYLSARVNEIQNGNAFILTLAPLRHIKRETPDFRTEQIDHWPHTTVVLLNHPNEQFILVQERSSAFANTDTVIKVLEKATRKALQNTGLRLHIENMFESSYFWDLIREHENRITRVEFEFVTPNMANISSSLEDTLKQLSKDTNAAISELELKSDPLSALKISNNNPTIRGLAEYISQGGGNISMKVRGIRKTIKTSNSSKEIQIDNIHLESSYPEHIIKIMRELLK